MISNIFSEKVEEFKYGISVLHYFGLPHIVTDK